MRDVADQPLFDSVVDTPESLPSQFPWSISGWGGAVGFANHTTTNLLTNGEFNT